jgi:predicted nucleic acid-binding protein
VDANVIIDLFIPDRPFSEHSIIVIDWLSDIGSKLFTSCDLITTVYYVLSKSDREKALDSIEDAITLFKLIPFSNEEVIEAVNLMRNNNNFKDLEDTIQYVLAKKENCDLILTNDKKFFSPDIETLTTKDFYEKFIPGE